MIDSRSSESGPLTIGFEKTEIRDSPETFAATFLRNKAIVLPKLISQPLIGKLVQRCRTGRFIPDTVEGLGTREVEAPQIVGGAITLLLRRPAVLRWVEEATGCGPLATVVGRVVQTRANDGDRLRWHDDLDDTGRRLGVTIGLSDTPHGGGEFQIRSRRESDVTFSFHHGTAGTGLIFDIRTELVHRVMPLLEGGPRRVYTGWFMQTAPN